ncbi:MAG: hypothetical protein IIA67_11075 [Planctomycetes bacterium]|nr:hypothetical protein [Planctomycetota bacterium]
MALDPRKRQKKLQRRKAKQKAKQKSTALRSSSPLALRLAVAEKAPLLHCCAADCIWEQGIGHVLISRTRGTEVAFGMFLLDMYCLGVKNAFFNVVSRSEYDFRIYETAIRGGHVDLSPECGRNLVEGAVYYARDLGFSPHRDYRQAKRIFGDIDASGCQQQFVYGKDGQPMFIAGPDDGAMRCRQIIDTLAARCGPDGFHFTMPVPSMGAFLDDDVLHIEPYEDD